MELKLPGKAELAEIKWKTKCILALSYMAGVEKPMQSNYVRVTKMNILIISSQPVIFGKKSCQSVPLPIIQIRNPV